MNMTESQQLQSELSNTALELARVQRKLQQTNQQLQAILQTVLDLAQTDDVEIKTVDDAVQYLKSKKGEENE